MNNSGNFSFSSSSNNNSNSSVSTNLNNDSNSSSGGQSHSSDASHTSVSNLIKLPILSLTIILALGYTVLILVRPAFRANKLNWFMINVCMTSTLLSAAMLTTTIQQIQNASSSLPCRVQGFIIFMSAAQMMYSHSMVAFSRFLTIVYANKHLFRSNSCLWTCIGSGWLLGVLVALPLLFFDGFICPSSTRPFFMSYYTLITVLILPITIVSACDIRIFLFVHRSSKRVHAEGNVSAFSHTRDVRLIKIMIITFSIFVVGWTPVFVEQIFNMASSVPTTVDAIFQILPPLSMLASIILLIYTNQPIRLYLWKLVSKCHRAVPVNMLNNTVKRNKHIIHRY